MQYHRKKVYEDKVSQSSGTEQHFLDITAYVCPMTFVRARLAMERLGAGQELVIRLSSGEPLENLPRSLAELGYRVVSLLAQEGGSAHLLRVAKD